MALMLQPHAESSQLRSLDQASHQTQHPSSRPPPDSVAPSSSGRPSSSHPDSRHKDRPRHGGESKDRSHDRNDRIRTKDHSSSHRLPSSSHGKQPYRDDKKAVQAYTHFTPDTKNRLKRPSTFLCSVYFSNGMPDPASQPKLVPLKDDPNRYTAYVGSSLEREHRHRLHLEPDLGIPLDLLDLSPYVPPPPHERPPLDPADQALLRDDDISTGAGAEAGGFSTPGGRGLKGSRLPMGSAGGHQRPAREHPSTEGLNWLMSTQYIAPVTAEGGAAKKAAMTEQEVKLLALQLELEDDQKQLSTREGRIQYIEASFQDALLPPKHPTNPNATPVEILPVLPRQGGELQRFLHVVFDEPPLKESKPHARLAPQAKTDLETQAMMKQYKTTSTAAGEPGKPFLAYMVPASADKERTEMAWEDGRDVPYSWVREYYYNLHVPKGDSEKEAFVFCFGKDSVQYLKLKGKLHLDKLKKMDSSRNSSQQNQNDEERILSRIPVPSQISVRKLESTNDVASRKRPRLQDPEDDE